MSQQQVIVRIQPEAISALRDSFADALARLNDSLVDLRRSGNLATPWLGDEVSNAVAAHYLLRAMDGPESSQAALLAYRDELGRVHDTLQDMEAHYRRTEDGNAALGGRLRA